MKDVVNVAVVQSAPARLDRATNLEEMVASVRRISASAPTELVVFPELATVGYVPPHYDGEFADALRAASDQIPGPITDVLGEVARTTGTSVIAGVSELGSDGLLYDSAVLLEPDGAVGGVQRKVHLWAEESHYFCPGDRFEVFAGDIGKVGMSICYDSRFPESTRVQALDGAEILVCIFALVEAPGQLALSTLLHRAATRALENTAFFIAANRTGIEPAGRFCGGSAVAAPSGELLAQGGGEGPPVVRARLLRADLIDARQYADVNVDRRPEVYTRLVAGLLD